MPLCFYRRGVDIQAAMDASYEVADLLAAHASGTKDDDGCDANSLSLSRSGMSRGPPCRSGTFWNRRRKRCPADHDRGY